MNDGAKKLAWAALAVACAMGLMLLFAGCSPTRQIAHDVGAIHDAADRIDGAMDKATTAYEEGADPRPFHREAQGESREIKGTAGIIHERLAGVEDREPAWMRLATLVVWVVGLGLVGFLIWRLGLDTIIRPIANYFGRMIPQKTTSLATLQAKMLAGKVTPQEVVAAQRASDPIHDKAFRKANAELEGA